MSTSTLIRATCESISSRSGRLDCPEWLRSARMRSCERECARPVLDRWAEARRGCRFELQTIASSVTNSTRWSGSGISTRRRERTRIRRGRRNRRRASRDGSSRGRKLGGRAWPDRHSGLSPDGAVVLPFGQIEGIKSVHGPSDTQGTIGTEGPLWLVRRRRPRELRAARAAAAGEDFSDGSGKDRPPHRVERQTRLASAQGAGCFQVVVDAAELARRPRARRRGHWPSGEEGPGRSRSSLA